MAFLPKLRRLAVPAAVGAFLFAGTAPAELLPPDSPVVTALDRCIAGLEAEAEARAEAGMDDATQIFDDHLEFDELRENSDGKPGAKPAPFVERCPEAHAGVAGSLLAVHLPPDWDREVAAGKLRRYRALLTEPPPESGKRPDTRAVAAIVKETGAAVDVQRRSLWQRFKDWLRSWLERGAEDPNADWLARWIDEHFPSAKVIDAILYAILAGMIALAGWFIYTELRAAGVLERWRRRRAAGGAVPLTAAAAPPAPTLDGASEAEAPSILLALLLGELRRLGRVQDRSSMTHRELARAVRIEGDGGAAFRQVLGAAERLRYGVAPPSGALRAAIEAGTRLLASLVRDQSRAT
jgi:hypothetical protein